MFESLDAVLLARIQFAFTIAFHILFPAFTIGLASWLAVVEGLWLKTRNEVYKEIYKQWIKIFAVCFGMGVVSGVVMSYQFGTNWSVFSHKVGNVIGPLLGYEVLTAFFLEASFLGIMLFGWGRVSEKMHFASTLIVAVGTLISAFWILSANSWMQTPQGYEIGADGIFYPTSWMEIIFNPSFPIRYMHTVTAAYLTTAFVVAGAASYYLYKRTFVPHARIMLGMAMILITFAAPMQVFLGDMQGLNSVKHQPRKVAAMEGIWETERGAGLRIFAKINQDEQKNDFELVIPKVTSLILTHDWNGEVKGLNEWPEEDQPPVAMVFYSFRIMVGIGMAMMLTSFIGLFLYSRGTLFSNKWFHKWCMLMTPAGFVAIITGWIVTEVGRQPFTVYGVMRTANSISPVAAEQVAITLLAFIFVYTIIFGAGAYYISKLIRKGPIMLDSDKEKYYDHSFEAAVIKESLPEAKKRGGKK